MADMARSFALQQAHPLQSKLQPNSLDILSANNLPFAPR